MKRRWIHMVFGGAAVCSAGVAVFYALQLKRTSDLDREIAAIRNAPVAQLSAAPANEAPEARLARAVALSAAHRVVDAARLYNDLTLGPVPARVRRAALFDLANMNLREAAGDDATGPVRSQPLIELAKTRYRDLLRDDPTDWDARYNYERALRLAPEAGDEADTDEDIEQQRSVTVRGAVPQELP
ncbi:MxaK protein [Paraburkholderia rhizosphaerae]|uniref:MxaK protein n=1 Tax=Paraburkholderia rhizosphaerae TaxID=480658 RepID=A0A4R8LYC7_9BURK|nr:MxaK protein [Paraburkholderia rhizosphaerae]TDY51797.1 mxaK protein [Paraburkholderia rhizosphaerae]